MTRVLTGYRALTAIVAVAAAAAIALSALALPPSQSASAADLSQFDPGNIISNEVFFDTGTMSASDIQAFFASKIGSCSAGVTCLLNYTESTTARSSDSYCAGYGGASNESSWQIVYNVSQSCGINPRVLIVMLQKEQGLVTARAPSSTAFRSAMGYACPDTAACSSTYYGFFNQVWNAAHQLQRYGNGTFRYKANQYNTIQYSPNASCGSSSVYIYNQATADLYNYTPYQPNAAALAAGYGLGDGCSAYGNRNFFNYFVDWFGATTYDVPGAIGTFWHAEGASSSEVGTPIGPQLTYATSNGTGVAQAFTKGYIYDEPAVGIAGLRLNSGIFATYAAAGSQYGAWGWPRTNEVCSTTGCAVDFQNGEIGWTAAAGIQGVTGAFADTYRQAGNISGPLGAPTSAPVAVAGVSGGQVQHFEGGDIYSRSASTVYLRAGSGITAQWMAEGGASGPLGWPTTSEQCTATSCSTAFDHAILTWTPSSGVAEIVAPILAPYLAAGGVTSGPGVAQANAVSVVGTDGGTWQTFSSSVIYSSGAGVFSMRSSSAIQADYLSLGGPQGTLGWPISAETCGATSCWTGYEHGRIYWSSSAGLAVVRGAVLTDYVANGADSGILGLPTSNEVAYSTAGGGSAQNFMGGYIYASGSSAYAERKNSAIFQLYSTTGSQYGYLGWPTSEEQCASTTCWTMFQNGRIGWSAPTGTHALSGGILTAFLASGGAAGSLGMPATDQLAFGVSGGGVAQGFASGYAYSSAAGTVYLLSGSGIFQRYAQLGSQYGPLGWPSSSEVCVGTASCSVTFQHGSISWISAGNQYTIVRGS